MRLPKFVNAAPLIRSNPRNVANFCVARDSGFIPVRQRAEAYSRGNLIIFALELRRTQARVVAVLLSALAALAGTGFRQRRDGFAIRRRALGRRHPVQSHETPQQIVPRAQGWDRSRSDIVHEFLSFHSSCAKTLRLQDHVCLYVYQ